MPFIDTTNLSYMSFGSGSRVNLHAYRNIDKPIPNNLFEEADGVFFVALGSMVLGAVRLAAWNFAFQRVLRNYFGVELTFSSSVTSLSQWFLESFRRVFQAACPYSNMG